MAAPKLPPQPLSQSLSPHLLSSVVLGRPLIHLPITTSTNDEIEKMAREGAEEGLVVWADQQTRGRGRMGRKWRAARGKDLLFSVLLRHLPAVSRQTVLAAVAVAKTIERGAVAVPRRRSSGSRRVAPARLRVSIKWPNDVLLNGRKVAGILVETRAARGFPNSPLRPPNTSQSPVPSLAFAILGIGVNVNSTTRDFPAELRRSATSLRIATGRWFDREALLRQLLAELDTQERRAQTDFAAVAEEWARRCSTLGKFVAIQVGSRRIEGTAWKLDEDGALVVRTESGRQERIVGGEVVLEKAHE